MDSKSIALGRKSVPAIETDLLVIGSGFAGLWAALTAREQGVDRVTLVDKASIGKSSQSRVCAGATIYCLPEDDVDVWLRDMAEAQGFLSRQDMVADMLTTSYSRLQRLEDWGVEYQRDPGEGGYLRLPSRGFRQVKMMVLPRRGRNIGGAAVVAALMRQIRRLGIESHPRILVTDLLRSNGRVAGALGLDRSSGELRAFHAGAVVLATADCSFRGSYACTEATTGDGFRLAYEAGARLSNLEFLCTNTGSPRFGFEGTGVALRWGGKILNAGGEAFMGRYHPDADAAEIGILTQAMAREVQKGNGPPFYLDMGGHWDSRLKAVLSGIGGFMPLNLERLEEEGIDLEEPQEWTPSVQGLRGGVRTGLDCQSDLPGLFAAGLSQALDPGLFNGWSTMRAMWSGETAGRGAARFLRDVEPARIDSDRCAELARRAVAALDRSGGLRPDDVLDRIQRSLFPYRVTILKEAASLSSALRQIEALRGEALSGMYAEDPHELAKSHETESMLQVAEMYLRASLARTESRGDHFREDYPEPDNQRWLAWVNLARGDAGQMVLETEPVPLDRYPCQPEQEARPR